MSSGLSAAATQHDWIAAVHQACSCSSLGKTVACDTHACAAADSSDTMMQLLLCRHICMGCARGADERKVHGEGRHLQLWYVAAVNSDICYTCFLHHWTQSCCLVHVFSDEASCVTRHRAMGDRHRRAACARWAARRQVGVRLLPAVQISVTLHVNRRFGSQRALVHATKCVPSQARRAGCASVHNVQW